MQHTIIINNNNVDNKLQAFIKTATSYFETNNINYTIHYTTNPDEAKKLVSTKDEITRFYICGGDGTFHHVLQEFNDMHEFVLLPFGTGNDFARLFITKDPYQIFYDSFKQETHYIDMMQVNHHLGLNTACFAIDNEIATHVHDHNYPFLPKKLSYLLLAIKTVFIYEAKNTTIKVDKQPVYQGKPLFATINNGKFYGGGYNFSKNAKCNDGLLNLCIIESFPKIQYLYKWYPLIFQKINLLKKVYHYQGTSFDIQTKQGVNIDGEFYDETNIHIDILPNKLKLVNKLK